MTTLLTIALVFGVVLIAGVVRAVANTINGDWPEPGQ